MSSSEWYEHGTYPATGAAGASSALRSELEAIETGISAKLPDMAGNGGEILAVNAGATALEAITTTGTGSGVRATSPTLVTPVLGVAAATTVNKVALTAPATGSTLTIADGKTLTASNSVTLTATDGSTLAIGTGGTLGTAAYTAATAYQPADAQLTDVAGLTPTDNGVIIGNGTNFVVESGATLKTSLGLTIGTDVQAYDADLTTWAGVTPGTGVATALAVAVGSAGAPVVNGGALGTPSSGSLANCTAYPGTSALTTVGALNSGSITSGFGSIDVGTDAISGGATSVTTLTGSGLYALFGGMTSRTGLYASNQQTVSNDGTGNLPFVSSNSWSSAGGGAGGLILGHSKSGVIGTHTTVANQDWLGTITFVGSDGTAFRQAASIYVIANDTVAANQVPGKLVINTTAITGNTGANFLTFDSAALLSVGTISTTRFSVDGATGNGSFAGTLSATGLLDLSAATSGQIKFPATQNASADPNTLDDYREGSFTGTCVDFTVTQTATIYYVKAGNKVTLYIPTFTGTSNAVSLNITGQPSFLTPSREYVATTGFLTQNNGAAFTMAGGYIRARIESWPDLTGGNFTTSGTKSLYNTYFSYII